MATLKQRLHRKNSSGTYDTVHLESSSDLILRPSGRTVEQDLADYLPQVQNNDNVPQSLQKLIIGSSKAWICGKELAYNDYSGNDPISFTKLYSTTFNMRTNYSSNSEQEFTTTPSRDIYDSVILVLVVAKMSIDELNNRSSAYANIQFHLVNSYNQHETLTIVRCDGQNISFKNLKISGSVLTAVNNTGVIHTYSNANTIIESRYSYDTNDHISAGVTDTYRLEIMSNSTIYITNGKIDVTYYGIII